MKKNCLYAITAILVVIAAPLPAQEEEGTMQMPRYSVNVTEHVKPGMMDEYIETTKKWLEMIKGKEMNMMFFAFGDLASNMHYAVPLTSMAEIDARAQDWSKAVAMMRGTDWGAQRQKCIEWTQYTIWMWGQEVSYQPAEPELSEADIKYFRWADIRVSHENEARFYELLGQIKAAYEKHGVGRPYNVYRNLVGLQGPFYTVVWGGKDPADVFNSDKVYMEKMGEDIMPLFNSIMDLVEEYTEGEGWSRLDLSLMPGM